MADAGTLTRRGLIVAAGAALGAAALPAGLGVALSAESPPMVAAGAVAFNPAAFVADLRAAGYTVSAMPDIPQPSWDMRAPTYSIMPARGRGFGEAYFDVMERWTGAMDACPDHVSLVVAYVLERDRKTFRRVTL